MAPYVPIAAPQVSHPLPTRFIGDADKGKSGATEPSTEPSTEALAESHASGGSVAVAAAVAAPLSPPKLTKQLSLNGHVRWPDHQTIPYPPGSRIVDTLLPFCNPSRCP